MTANKASALPLGPAQKMLWYEYNYSPDNCAYNVPVVIRLNKRLDVTRLRSAVARLVRGRSALRVTIGGSEVVPSQLVSTHSEMVLTVVDGVRWSSAETLSRIADDARTPFRLSVTPPIRISIYRAGESDFLSIVAHHIVLDGWSIGLLLRDLWALYEDGRLLLAADDAEYARAAMTRAARESNPHEREQAYDYWRSVLSGFVPIRLGTSSFPGKEKQGQSLPFEVLPDVISRLAGVARYQRTSLASMFASVTVVALAAHTGQRDITFKTAVANRDKDSMELVGCYFNVVPLRAKVDGAWNFGDLVARVSDHWWANMSWSWLPAADIGTLVDARPNGREDPFGDVMLVVEEFEVDPFEALPDGAELITVETATAQLSLTLHISRLGADRVVLMLEHSSSIVSEDAIEFGNLWLRIADLASSGQLDPLSMVTHARPRPAAIRPAVAVAHGSARSLSDIVLEHVRRAPSSTAIQLGNDQYSYLELMRRVSVIVKLLRESGIAVDAIVALRLGRSVDWVASMLAVETVGASFFSLPPSLPSARVMELLRDGHPAAIITETPDAMVEEFRNEGWNVLFAPKRDDRLPTPNMNDVHEIGTDVPSAAAAYVMYTSGSTGSPKGIVVTREGIYSNLDDLTECIGLSSDDRVLAISPATFDMSVFETLGTLRVGATCVLLDDHEQGSPGSWLERVVRDRVSVWHSAPQLLELLVDLAMATDTSLDSLRVAALGGDRVDPGLPLRLAKVASQCRLIVLGGATEASIHSTVYDATDYTKDLGAMPYGTALPAQRAYVLNDSLENVMRGELGELFLAGTGITRGYLRHPRLTASRFVPDPWGTPGSRMYRTGDLVREGSDGLLRIIGRSDTQVKIHGVRVEVEEAERLLNAATDNPCAVVSVATAPGQFELVGFLFGATWRGRERQARRALTALAPLHLVPQRLKVMELPPLTANGKLDRRALSIAAAEHEEVIAALDALDALDVDDEIALAVRRAWRSSLPQLPADEEDFFDVGGTSLGALVLLQHLRVETGHTLGLQDFLTNPTIRGCIDLLHVSTTELSDANN
jgi:amino acid adenylation domain-containing protein